MDWLDEDFLPYQMACCAHLKKRLIWAFDNLQYGEF